MPDGTVVETGGITEDNPGYDLTGLVVGNEGTFGIVTKVGRQPHARPRGRPDVPGASSTRSTRRRRPSAGSSPPGSCRPRSRCSTT